MATDQKMIPAVGILLHALQVTKAAVRQEQESARDLGTNEGQQLGNEAHVVGIAILVGVHAEHQARFIVQGDQCPSPQQASAHSRNSFKRLATFLIALPSMMIVWKPRKLAGDCRWTPPRNN